MDRQGLRPKQATQEWEGELSGRGAGTPSKGYHGHTSAVPQLWDNIVWALPLPGSHGL